MKCYIMTKLTMFVLWLLLFEGRSSLSVSYRTGTHQTSRQSTAQKHRRSHQKETEVSYCIVLHCILLYFIVLHCIALYCILLYCIVLYCITLYCMCCLRRDWDFSVFFSLSCVQWTLFYVSSKQWSIWVYCTIWVVKQTDRQPGKKSERQTDAHNPRRHGKNGNKRCMRRGSFLVGWLICWLICWLVQMPC